MQTHGSLQGNPSHQEKVKSGAFSNPHHRTEDRFHGPGWYFSRKEIEENSPSRRDGIDLKKEVYLRKAYCTFVQDLGMRLKVPQMTIATAIVFCHRFFLRQSHAKNDRRTIATVCMFLAGKVEETPRPLKDVILVSYDMIHKKDPSAAQKIKQKEVYEQQKELILLGERLVLTTLSFDFTVQHPYKPVVEAIKKFISQNGLLAQVAWNFVNDGLRTSLCLQFNPHHIAAGAIFLAAKFLKVKLPTEGDKAWWQEFGVTPRQLEDISNQILELYEQNRAGQSSHPNEVESSAGDGTNHVPKATSIVSENSMSVTGPPQDVETVDVKHVAKVPPTSTSVPALSNSDEHRAEHRRAQGHSTDSGSTDTKSGVWDHKTNPSGKDKPYCQVKPSPSSREQDAGTLSCSKSSLEQPIEEGLTIDKDMVREVKEETMLSKSAGTSRGGSRFDDAITMIDRDKVKAAFEKRKRLRNDMVKKTDILDEDDLIERELENGVEMAAEDEKMKLERRSGSPELLHKKRPETEKRIARVSGNQYSHGKVNSKSSDHHGIDNPEEAELSSLEENELGDNKETAWVDYPERDQKRVRCDTLVE